MSEQPRFGESFVVKSENRLDPLHENSEVPEYVVSSREVRSMLQEAAKDPENAGWEVMPEEVKSAEDLFDQAKELVTRKWNEKVYAYVAEKCRGWAAQLSGNEKFTTQAALLGDPVLFEEKLRIRQFGSLESIRTVLPEAWRELVLISSERQMAEIAVARRWVKGMEPDRKVEGSSKKELEIFIDAAAILSKYIDQAYVKQIELADAPGGSEATKLGQSEDKKVEKGARHLYDIYKPLTADHADSSIDDIDIKPYADVFPLEWNRIVKSARALADKVEASQSELGRAYEKLPAYLRKLADTYDSRTIDPKKLYDEKQELLRDMRELAKDGCPVMFIPQDCPGVAGDANKVDVELRFGIKTKETRELEALANEFLEISQEFNDENVKYFSKRFTVPPVIINEQPFASGPNISWVARGESGEEAIVAHFNVVEDVAMANALPALRKMFGDIISEEDFKYGSNVDNALHEVGHTLLYRHDEAILKRIGDTSETKAAEELKADTGNMKLLQEYVHRGNKSGVDVKKQFIAKLGDICDYLKNKSNKVGAGSEKYFAAGLAMISRLLDRGVIMEKGEGVYDITNHEDGVRELAGLADELMEFYKTGTPEKLQEYINAVRARAKDEKVAKFVETLRK